MRGIVLTLALSLSLSLSLSLAACSSSPTCREGTVLLDLSFSGAAREADTLAVDVFVDGAFSRSSTLTREPGTERGTLEIQFPTGYPAGRALTVRVTAQRSSVSVGVGVYDATALPSCTTLTLAVGDIPDGGIDSGACLPATCASLPAACGTPSDGCGGALDCGACFLADRSSPPIANTAASVTLEGRFAPGTTVQFPGAAQPSAPTVAGPNRLIVPVPADATMGGLTLSYQGGTLGPVPFQRAAFSLGLTRVDRYPTQANAARASSAPKRGAPTGHAHGDYLYLFGGLITADAVESTVARARINFDGSIDLFETLPGTALATPVYNHTSIVVGDDVYLIGGMTAVGMPPTTTVQRARFMADGSLSTFTAVGALTKPRRQTAAVVIGSYIYVLGGNLDAAVTDEIERAEIAADGTLGAFSVVPGVALATARGGHRALVIGDKLYVLGGDNNSSATESVEVSTIRPDGSLAGFTASGPLMIKRTDTFATVIGSGVYLIGGRGPSGPLRSIERAEIAADGTLGTFSVVADQQLAVTRYAFASAWVSDSVYLFSGQTSSAQLGTLEILQANSSGELAAFAPHPEAPLASPLERGCSVVVGRSLYFIGGVDGVQFADAVQRATLDDTGKPSAFQIVGHLTTPRRVPMCAVIGNRIYVLGGATSGPVVATSEYATFDATGALSAFVAGPSLTVARRSAVVAALGNLFYVIGGADPAGTSLKSADTAVINADGTLGVFGALGDVLPTARANATSAIIADKLYVFGGADTAAATIASYDVATIDVNHLFSAFQAGPSIGVGRYHASAAVVGPFVYLFGGVNVPVATHRASINALGALGMFNVDLTSDLNTNRSGQSVVRAQSRVIVVGGTAGSVTESAIFE